MVLLPRAQKRETLCSLNRGAEAPLFHGGVWVSGSSDFAHRSVKIKIKKIKINVKGSGRGRPLYTCKVK
jgi:hypothetical protein